jgi:hypothetical protein
LIFFVYEGIKLPFTPCYLPQPKTSILTPRSKSRNFGYYIGTDREKMAENRQKQAKNMGLN